MVFQAKTFAEAVKSPKKEKKAVRSGLKLPVVPKEETQKTLEDAFTAGALYKEAKELKRKALMAKKEIKVNLET